MDVPAGNVRVTILGDEYSIRGDVDPETTRHVAEYVDQKLKELREKSASNDKFKVAILTAMNIAGELFESTSANENLKAQIHGLEQNIESVTRKIDENL